MLPQLDSTSKTVNGNGAHGMDGEEILAMLRSLVNDARVDTGSGAAGTGESKPSCELTPQDIAKLLLEADVSDNGNAICVASLYPNRFLWCDAYGWMYYHDGYWESEGAEAALDAAVVDVMRRRILAAFDGGKTDQGERIWKFCTANSNRVSGTKALLKHHVSARPDQFDSHKDLLNVTNGVVDLRTGNLTPHDPKLRFMSRTDIAYKPNANSAPWVEWLMATIGGGESMVEWLQMAVGYTLTAHTHEDVMFYLYGPGRSGKGTFTSALQDMLGPRLSKATSFETFTAKRDADAQNFALAPLQTARMIVASETEKNQRLSSAKVKTITGGDQISCSFKGRDHFNYTPGFKIWLSSNFPVNGDPDDDALWSRVRVIEFPNGHIGNEDRSIKKRMRTQAVLEGSLAWAVRGSIRWYALDDHGLPEPQSSADIKAAQRGEQDSVGQWLSECATLKAGSVASSAQIFNSYRHWCEENGHEPKLQKALTQSLRKKGCTTPDRSIWHEGKTQRVVYGIELLQV